jgi:hypothetical protein
MEGDGTSVGDAARLEFDRAGSLDPVEELVEQPGLASAGLADQQGDRALTPHGAVVGGIEPLDLPLASDKCREAALARHL